jgi:hypothetical protein
MFLVDIKKNIKINMFWIGEELSNLEILSIKSHLKVGHNVYLWCYETPKNTPKEVVIKNAGEILQKKDIFSYQRGEGRGSFSACSNLFRYKLIYEYGGWWSDTDVVALKKFNFDKPYVFASERNRNFFCFPTTCVFKCERKSKIMKDCLEIAEKIDKETLEWSTIGPKLLSKSVFNNWLEDYVLSPDVFCPINWFDVENNPLIENAPNFENSYAIHMWHEMWRRNKIDKNKQFDKNCLFEKLKNDIL